MKGNKKSIYKIIFLALVICAATVCAVVPFLPKHKQAIYAAQQFANKNASFSGEDELGNIFSVEKVAVASSNNKFVGEVTDPNSYTYPVVEAMTTEATGLTAFPSSYKKSGESNYRSYYYKDIPDAETGLDKTVVKNNEYVKLENIKVGTYYRSTNSSLSGYQEAIMVSFGVYSYQGENVTIDNTENEMTAINIMASVDGEEIAYIPQTRKFEVNDIEYQDFSFLIPQREEYEGHWKFEVKDYRYQGQKYSDYEFDFYLLFNTSYTQVEEVNDGEGSQYTAEPTITHATQGAISNEYSFVLGSSDNYPMLTFDYTKYRMSYTHTANGIKTTATCEFQPSADGNKLIIKKTALNETIEYEYLLVNYRANVVNNYAVIVFSEMGEYSFTFDYIWEKNPNDETITEAPAMTLKSFTRKLTIVGFEIKYTKAGYEEAQLRHFTFYYGNEDKADLVVLDGYNINAQDPDPEKYKKLGIAYSLVTEKTNKKVGAIVNRVDANYKTASSVTGADEKSAITEDEFVKTNQGSIWIMSSVDYIQGINNSYYYFGQTLDELQDEETEAEEFTNVTEFNVNGYYLVVLAVDSDGNGVKDFDQAFAFQFTTDTINIEVTDVDGKIIGAGKYTNKNVVVDWTPKPGVFDRKITATNYYFAQTHDLSEIITGTAHDLVARQPIGSEVTSGQTWATYVIEIKSAGKSAVYRMFTIDTQAISGVSVYAVEPTIKSGVKYYEYVMNGTNAVKLGAVSNSYSTLYWNDKASLANVKATYSYIPFVRDNAISVGNVYNSNNQYYWINTPYTIGEKVSGLEISKTSSKPGSQVDVYNNQIFSQQGIYEFTIEDEAGNSCVYLFVIDKTESYFFIQEENKEGSYSVRESILSGDTVSYTVGTHKAISLGEDSSKLTDYVNKALTSTGLSGDAEYYNGDNSNRDDISAMFNKIGGELYFTVKNLYVRSRNELKPQDTTGGIDPITYAYRSNRIEYISDSDESSTYRQLYIVGENQIKTLVDYKDSNSYVAIEINPDNSRVMIYSDIEPITKVPNNDEHERIRTGSNIYGAFATRDSNVTLTWQSGVGYEVQKVEYQHYVLNEKLETYNVVGERYEHTFFYVANGEPVTVFEDNVCYQGTVFNSATGKAYVAVNESNGVTAEGLYVVTRTYSQAVAEGSKDETVKKYYFIVDRHGIVDNAAGKEIRLELLENENAFADFNQVNTISGTLDEFDIDYNIYLTTNKVPVTLRVPYAKYFKEDKGTNPITYYSSSYYSGKLQVEVYFNDTNSQIENGIKSYKMFEFTTDNFVDTHNGYITIDFKEFANIPLKGETQLLGKFEEWANGANWMYLPGDYVVVIKDTTLSNSDKSEQQIVFGFRVQHEEPDAKIYATTTKDATFDEAITKIGEETTLTTNQAYVKLNIDKYNPNTENAELDDNYLYIERSIGGEKDVYINYQYESGSAKHDFLASNDYVKRDLDGNITIILDTFNKNGKLEIEKEIRYTIKVRYRLWTDEKNKEKYANCYGEYINGVYKTFYERVYTVIIDRIAPDANIIALMEQDKLVDEFNSKTNEGNEMFESAVSNTSGVLSFMKRYKAYYSDNMQDLSRLYAFRIQKDVTKFKTEDVASVSARFISTAEIVNLKLRQPIEHLPYVATIDQSQEYTYTNLLNAMFRTPNSGLYEIIESDAAGNKTQYLIEYYDSVVAEESGVKMVLNVKDIEDKSYNLTLEPGANLEKNSFIEIIKAGSKIETQEYFYIIEIQKQLESGYQTIEKIYANLSETDLINNIVSVINGEANSKGGFGNYCIKVYLRSETSSSDYYINFYNKSDIIVFSVEKLITNDWKIDLNEASITDKGVTYYFKEILVQYVHENVQYVDKYESDNGTTYTVCQSVNGGAFASRENVDNKVINTIKGVVYVVKATDSLGRNSGVSKFKSGDPDYVYCSIDFPGGYIDLGTYYTIQQAVIRYDTTIFDSKSIVVAYKLNNRQKEFTTEDSIAAEEFKKYEEDIYFEYKDGTLILYPYINALTGAGALLEFEITIDGADEDKIYKIVMDTRTASIKLEDFKTGKDEKLAFQSNLTLKEILATNDYTDISSGSKTLIWSDEFTSNDRLGYSYTLYETMLVADADGKNYVVHDLNNKNGSYRINTSVDSKGEYRFVVTIFEKANPNNILGNKVYTFVVKSELNGVYYVQTSDNQTLEANSYIISTDMEALALKNELGQSIAYNNILGSIPMYISNDALKVITVSANMKHNVYVDADFNKDSHVFELHEIDATTFKMYFAILKVVDNTNSIINSLLISNAAADSPNKNLSIWTKSNLPISMDEVKIVGSKFFLTLDTPLSSEPTGANILNKNIMVMDFKYGIEHVATKYIERGSNTFEINGNGTYRIEIRDLAGNQHLFETSLESIYEYAQITMLKQVEILINDDAPIDRAYYNGVVKFSIPNRGDYEQGSISWKALRNGDLFAESSIEDTKEFDVPGTYRLIVQATPKGELAPITKELVFTLVNENEAKNSFDLTSIASHEIVKILDHNNEDVTNLVMDMFSTSTHGMLLTYDMLAENPNINMGTGKQTFTVLYKVDDGLYPVREESFKFTMNNETPYIKCSLKPGETTKKGFTISFNASIIYKQVGDSIVYVNGKEVARIEGDPANQLTKLRFTEKKHGAGDYYITLESVSGDIILVFKVKMKEPLNTSAIIIIVVVSAVVIAVVVTIIVLRTKMRIR